MNTKPQSPAPAQTPAQERYYPGDPIPVPDAVEANTESTWALFSDSATDQAVDFADTIPAELPLMESLPEQTLSRKG